MTARIIEKDGGLVVEDARSKRTWTSRSLGDWRSAPPPRKRYRLFITPDGEPIAIVAPNGERGYVPKGSARAEKAVRTALAISVNAERRGRALTDAERDVIEMHLRDALKLVGPYGVKQLGDKIRMHPDGVAWNSADGMRARDLRSKVTITVGAAGDSELQRLKGVLDGLAPPSDAEAIADEAERLRQLGLTLSVTQVPGNPGGQISTVS